MLNDKLRTGAPSERYQEIREVVLGGSTRFWIEKLRREGNKIILISVNTIKIEFN